MTGSGSLQALRARYGERYRWLVLLAVMVGTMASVMSSTVVNVAIPDMSQHFALGQERAQWVASGFMVAMTVSMLTTPWLLSRYGYRATYAGSMLLLLLGGMVGGLSSHYGLVLAARVAEGLAAGIVQPIPAIIILYAFQPHEQGRASGIFGMGVVLAPALGPSIGGLLVDWFGWRSIFFMVVPLCIVSLWLAYKLVPNTAPGGLAANRQSQSLDWRGLLLGGAGTLCLLNGLVELRSGPLLQALVLLVLAAVCALLTFVVGEVVAPPAERAAQQLRLKERGRTVSQDLRSGLWVKDERMFINVQVVLPDHRLRGIRIYDFDENAHLRSVIEAAEGEYLPPDGWRLKDIVQTRLYGERSEIRRLADMEWRSALNPDILSVLMVSPDRMSLPHLSSYIKHLAENNQKTLVLLQKHAQTTSSAR